MGSLYGVCMAQIYTCVLYRNGDHDYVRRIFLQSRTDCDTSGYWLARKIRQEYPSLAPWPSTKENSKRRGVYARILRKEKMLREATGFIQRLLQISSSSQPTPASSLAELSGVFVKIDQLVSLAEESKRYQIF
jgi:hypothetical protein